MPLTILAFIIVLGVIIFVHELGHFIAAKLVGIRVETFSLGFPPKMVSKKIGDTEYVIAWIPLGGYVKMAGMVDESMDDKPLTGAPWEFMSKSYLQKIFVITAGVLMNFLLGIIVYFLLTWNVGVAEIDQPVVGSVQKGFPAEEIGIQKGDRIVSIAGDSIATWQDLTKVIHASGGQTLDIEWVRENQRFTAQVVPRDTVITQRDSTFHLGLIGINPEPTFKKVGFFASVERGFRITWFIIEQTLIALKRLIFGQGSLKEVSGPIGIAQISGETIRSGFVDFIWLIANISVSIGLLNIFPFPVLDGGHVVYITIEAIIRRPISTKVKLNIQKVGLALLLAFFLLVSYHDILKIISGK
jgi:regulator of sigma E protease